MLEGGRISRARGEPATGPLLIPIAVAGPECVRCTYLKGDCAGVEVVGVTGPSEADRGASAVLPAPVGDSSELMSIFTVYCSPRLLIRRSFEIMRRFHLPPIARGTLSGRNETRTSLLDHSNENGRLGGRRKNRRD